MYSGMKEFVELFTIVIELIGAGAGSGVSSFESLPQLVNVNMAINRQVKRLSKYFLFIIVFTFLSLSHPNRDS